MVESAVPVEESTSLGFGIMETWGFVGKATNLERMNIEPNMRLRYQNH